MGDVIHRATLQFKRSANEPDHPEPVWKHAPYMAGVAGVDPRYWKAPADWNAANAGPVEMTQPEKDAVDAAEAAALQAANRVDAVASVDTTQEAIGWNTRALIEIFNKRDNYLVNRVSELQAALDAVKASSGPADNIRAAIPASWLATNTRPRPDAVQDYKDRITTGEVDT